MLGNLLVTFGKGIPFANRAFGASYPLLCSYRTAHSVSVSASPNELLKTHFVNCIEIASRSLRGNDA